MKSLTRDPKNCEPKFLRLILAKLAEIEAQFRVPLKMASTTGHWHDR
jgi:hypothetical protein